VRDMGQLLASTFHTIYLATYIHTWNYVMMVFLIEGDARRAPRALAPRDTPQKMTVLRVQKFYLIFVPERYFCGVSQEVSIFI
jgi:hypothetical protein